MEVLDLDKKDYSYIYKRINKDKISAYNKQYHEINKDKNLIDKKQDFICDICGGKYSTYGVYSNYLIHCNSIKHKKTISGEDTKKNYNEKHNCNICDGKYTTINFSKHIRTHKHIKALEQLLTCQ